MVVIPPDQIAHREDFGRALTAWMRLNGWSQQTLHDAAKAWHLQGPWNSQVSCAQRGLLDPKSQFWVSLGQLNANVASGDLAAITARGLRDRLKGAQPYLNASGDVATAVDLFAQFVGMQPIAEQYAAPALPAYTEEDAKGISDMCRESFRRIATDQMLNPKEAWEALKPHCSDMTAAEVTRFREILAGWEDWSAEEVNALSVPGELGKPAQALGRWGGAGLSNHVVSA